MTPGDIVGPIILQRKGNEMNLAQINEWRAAHGLSALTANPAAAEKRKRLERNRANRAQENRNRRNGKGKK